MNKRRSKRIETVLNRLDDCINYHEGKKGFNNYYSKNPRPLHNLLFDIFYTCCPDFDNIYNKGSRAIKKHCLSDGIYPRNDLDNNIISDVNINTNDTLILYKKNKKDYVKEDNFLEMLDIIKTFGGKHNGVCKYFVWGGDSELNVKLYNKERQWIETKGFKFISNINLKIPYPLTKYYENFPPLLINGWLFEIPTIPIKECREIIENIKAKRKQELI